MASADRLDHASDLDDDRYLPIYTPLPNGDVFSGLARDGGFPVDKGKAGNVDVDDNPVALADSDNPYILNAAIFAVRKTDFGPEDALEGWDWPWRLGQGRSDSGWHRRDAARQVFEAAGASRLGAC